MESYTVLLYNYTIICHEILTSVLRYKYYTIPCVPQNVSVLHTWGMGRDISHSFYHEANVSFWNCNEIDEQH